MEYIIQKAIDGMYIAYRGAAETNSNFLERCKKMPVHMKEFSLNDWLRKCCIDPLFWHSLGKSCGWLEHDFIEPNQFIPTRNWIKHALRFHEINLTQSWDAAVEYLTSITK